MIPVRGCCVYEFKRLPCMCTLMRWRWPNSNCSRLSGYEGILASLGTCPAVTPTSEYRRDHDAATRGHSTIAILDSQCDSIRWPAIYFELAASATMAVLQLIPRLSTDLLARGHPSSYSTVSQCLGFPVHLSQKTPYVHVPKPAVSDVPYARDAHVRYRPVLSRLDKKSPLSRMRHPPCPPGS